MQKGEVEPATARDQSETLFPSAKRRYQSTQLMNILLRPLVVPLIRLLALLGVNGDLASVIGLAGYCGGAYLFIGGGPEQQNLALLFFMIGLLAELVDGGLARLKGPTSIGHFLSKVVESFFIVLLAPSLAIGLYLNHSVGLNVFLIGVFAPAAHLQFRAAIDEITMAHPAEQLAQLLDNGASGARKIMVGQILPNHSSFTWKHRLGRTLRENLMESSGIQPAVLAVTVLSGHASWFVIYYGCVQISAWLGFILLKLLMLKRGGGRLL
jgi:phosphatidylglycerophosphate synthase